MEVHLPVNHQDELNELSARTGQRTDELVQEAIARLLANDKWFNEQVQIGIDQIESSSRKKKWTCALSAGASRVPET
jgi:hypothetical protein